MASGERRNGKARRMRPLRRSVPSRRREGFSLCPPPVFAPGAGGRAVQGSLGEKIGEGAYSDVHAWAPGQVVKLFKAGFPWQHSW